MGTLPEDTARFRADDPEELVRASFACPVCLHGGEVEWKLERDGYDPSVECECHHCEGSWRVYVTPDQVLRLALIAVRAS